MNLDPVRELLFRTVSETFHVQAESLSPTTTAQDVNGWDSMAHGLFIMALESAFGFELPLDRALEAANLGDMEKLLREISEGR